MEGPRGGRGRNPHNTRLKEVLGWEPEIAPEDGIARTYEWIEEQVWAKHEGLSRELSAQPGSGYSQSVAQQK